MDNQSVLSKNFHLSCSTEGVEIAQVFNESNVHTYQITIVNLQHQRDVLLEFRLPALNIMGVWKSNALLSKRLQADWELEHLNSRVSVDAPVVSVFTQHDDNFITFALSDAVNLATMNARIREEDGFIYGRIELLKEPVESGKNYSTQLRVDFRPLHFSQVLQETAHWWSEFYPPMHAPQSCYYPIYSTWYSYHQNLVPESLLAECSAAYEMGFRTIIVDDGWQTQDNSRGYDYTGDWEPQRIPQMEEFVGQVHDLGMKFMMWYSVPFCGKKSAAYQDFKGKFLTENHRWAPVFDPRYPEVRSFLISKYLQAVEQWSMDGLKLDFIDDFRVYPETDLNPHPDRDYNSVNKAVEQLLSEIVEALQAVRPEIMIEFRQQYTGPAVRQFGNMFRAFDCPHDPVTNRVRTADIRLLGDQVAAHSDMLTWHYEESVENVGVQLANSIFSVPQISVRLAEIPSEHAQAIAYYTKYWLTNQQLLMKGQFVARKPLLNYPLIEVSNTEKVIYGVYDSIVVGLASVPEIDLINGSLNEFIAIKTSKAGCFDLRVMSCTGMVVTNTTLELLPGITEVAVPAAGMITLKAQT